MTQSMDEDWENNSEKGSVWRGWKGSGNGEDWEHPRDPRDWSMHTVIF